MLASQVYAILRDGISADELDRAKGPLRENAVKQLESNAYWESRLALRLRDERMDGPILGAAKDVEAVSAEDVASLLRRIVVERAPVRIEAIAKQ